MNNTNVSSREKLDMDLSTMNVANNRGKFKFSEAPQSKNRANGVFVKKWVLSLVLLIAVFCIVGVGFLVGFLNPRTCACHGLDSSSVLNNCSFDATFSTNASTKKSYVRLPTSVLPEHYDVELKTFIGPTHFYFDGNVSIAIRCIQETRNITLHFNDLIIYNDTVLLKDNQGNDPPAIVNFTQNAKLQLFIVQLQKPLVSGHNYTLQMSFKGNLNDDLAGFYKSSYVDRNGEKRWLAVTQFQPTDARRAFPCFDEPSMKASFNITLVHFKNMTAISNMPIEKTIERGEWVVDRFQRTVKMSTYLLAFVISDLEMITNHSANFTIWSRNGSVSTARYSLEIGPKILKFYESFFNIPYPLPKTDMVAVPDFNAGAMENWGLIIYRETTLLYDPIVSSATNLQRVAHVVAHELAHQWFGNLVTPQWWDDLWLNEGFASYMEYQGVHAVHPQWEMFQQFVVNEIHDVFELDCLTTSHPISVKVYDPDEINEIFDHISYGKGASIIRMMNYFLGNEKFRNGVSNYLRAFRYKNAVQDDLWKYLSEAVDNTVDVKKVMDSWTLQKGYPTVTLTRDYQNRKASLTQKRFLLATVNESSEIDLDKCTWEIPITYTDSRRANWNPTTKLWIHNTSRMVSVPDEDVPRADEWMMVNIQEVGYYRVNYDLINWKLLIDQLTIDHTKIHTINRAQIIDDALDLARADLLDYQIALNTTQYLVREREYVPWEAAFNAFTFLDKMLRRREAYGQWKEYVLSLITDFYKEIGWNVTEGSDDLLRKYSQVNILAWTCKYGLDECVRKSLEQFQNWKNFIRNGKNPIHPNLRSLVYCTGIEHGNDDDWDFVWNQYLEAPVASEKEKLLKALACSKEPWLLSRYILRAFNSSSGIRKQDGSFVFRAVATSNYGRDIAFNFFREHWESIVQYYGKSFFSFGNLIKSVTSSLKTEFELKQLEDFYKNEFVKNNLGTAQRSFKQAIERTKANVQWIKSHYQKIELWLKNKMDKKSR